MVVFDCVQETLVHVSVVECNEEVADDSTFEDVGVAVSFGVGDDETGVGAIMEEELDTTFGIMQFLPIQPSRQILAPDVLLHL